ncbi:MAG: hypothetical protein DWQ19_10800 [Crenarchaeota archaeon]|nr:MAG: hypothetical protein DWQ19_10800 [Thermoproteota archaeon]
MKRFFYHYNRPASQQRGKPTISVHYDNKCHLVDGVEVKVPTISRINPKRSPKFVMIGKCKDFKIKKGVAIIS